MRRLLLLIGSFVFIVSATANSGAGEAAEDKDKGNLVHLELKYGTVVIRLRPDLAPNHVKRVKELIGKKFYDGHKFHRVIAGFMAQTGDPTGTGRGGSGKNIDAEFSDTASFGRGTVGAARSSDINSADSQFFICFVDCSNLDGQYTIWGEVIKGMEFVDKIRRGEPPSRPDEIVKMRMAKEEAMKKKDAKEPLKPKDAKE